MTHPELTNGKEDAENSGVDKKEQDRVNGNSVIERNKNDVHKNNEMEKVKLNGIHPAASESNSTSNSVTINSDGKAKETSSDSDSYLTPHPILETHNYAKIPLIPSMDSNNGSLGKTAVTENR